MKHATMLLVAALGLASPAQAASVGDILRSCPAARWLAENNVRPAPDLAEAIMIATAFPANTEAMRGTICAYADGQRRVIVSDAIGMDPKLTPAQINAIGIWMRNR